MGLLVTPFAIVPSLRHCWPYGELVCQIQVSSVFIDLMDIDFIYYLLLISWIEITLILIAAIESTGKTDFMFVKGISKQVELNSKQIYSTK